jgi:Subtilisin inhibitor-like
VHRLALLVAVLATAVALPASALAGAIDLRIAYRASETAAPKRLELHCTPPPHGSVATPAAACRKLIAIGDRAFARPRPQTQACAQIFGGPQTALVTGIYFGRPVWAKLSRVDGCAIARWNSVAFLFPKSS